MRGKVVLRHDQSAHNSFPSLANSIAKRGLVSAATNIRQNFMITL